MYNLNYTSPFHFRNDNLRERNGIAKIILSYLIIPATPLSPRSLPLSGNPMVHNTTSTPGVSHHLEIEVILSYISCINSLIYQANSPFFDNAVGTAI